MPFFVAFSVAFALFSAALQGVSFSMGFAETLLAGAGAARDELLLFAAVGLLVGGLDDLALDMIYAVRRLWRRFTVYSRHRRMTADRLPQPMRTGTMAVLIPAWDEGDVIGDMLRHCLRQWRSDDVQLFVGAYPNDPATIAAVDRIVATDPRVTLVVNPAAGPTTKADCLNTLWLALCRWEAERGARAKAIILHDAEDVVHRDAVRLLSVMVERFALVQLPVLPLASQGSRWVSGHYCDEFAEAHAKALMVREALGAALPSAGVGCAIERDAIGALAEARQGRPFDPGSLTEDYELGLRIGETGGRGIILRMREGSGELIATREYFPDTLDAAVRQKARWTVGIALAGWDRLGWGAGWVENWMRLRDRRAPLAAIVLLAAYVGAVLGACLWIAQGLGLAAPRPMSGVLTALLWLTGLLLGWRLLVRAIFVHRAYGMAEALRSVPRTFIANIIAILAARRAVWLYIGLWRGGSLQWDKTRHRFPDLATVEDRAT